MQNTGSHATGGWYTAKKAALAHKARVGPQARSRARKNIPRKRNSSVHGARITTVANNQPRWTSFAVSSRPASSRSPKRAGHPATNSW